ncbi:MAG: nucleic acid-binding protein [Treponema sp.]|nr:nucleic acid-binding protein [Treponema sp.]
MTIAETFENLKSLQKILVEKYALEEKVENAPKQLQVQDEALARSKKEYIAINSEYDEVKDGVLKLKVDLEAAVKSREEGEKGMDNITTHREYEALEKQINEATARETELRRDLQHQEKKLTDLNEQLKNKKGEIDFQESDLAESKSKLDSEINEYKSKLEELTAEEKKITPNLDQEIIFKFERIIQRNTEGIVSVKNGVCSGCHMILPAQFANIVREGESINFCPYCSRILYYEEVSEAEQEDASFNFNVSGSLADLDDDDDDDEYSSVDEDEENYDETEENEDEYDEDLDDSDESDDSDDEENSDEE